MTINTVWSGEYKDRDISGAVIEPEFSMDPNVSLSLENVESYTIIDAMPSPRFSYGGAQLDWDMEYIIKIVWKDGKQSVIYIDRENYLWFIREMYSI